MMTSMKDTDLQDDLGEEMAMEQELAKLQRQYRIMDADRKAYTVEAVNTLRKQQTEIQMLKQEHTEIMTNLGKVEADDVLSRDRNQTETLVDLVQSADGAKQAVVEENQKIAQLDAEIRAVERKIGQQRKKMGGVIESDLNQYAKMKSVRVLENRLDKAMVKFNKQLAHNTALRTDIDHLRQERKIFDNLVRKMSKELGDTKREVREAIDEARHSFELRDEAQNKMLALKDRYTKEQQQHDIEMKDLIRVINHDNKLRDFMGIKSDERVEYKQDENTKKRRRASLASYTIAHNILAKDTKQATTIKKIKHLVETEGTDALAKKMGLTREGLKQHDHDKATIDIYESAFERIKEVTNQTDLNTIVTNFIKREDSCFALFNYVNELNNEVEGLIEHKERIRGEMDKFMSEEVSIESERLKMLEILEVKLSATNQDQDDGETRAREISKILDQVRVSLASIFAKIGCDARPLHEMLGSAKEVTDDNMMMYLGLVEQKTNELVAIHHYLEQMKMPDAKVKAFPLVRPPPPVVKSMVFVPPTTGDSDEDEEEEGEVRPFTSDELKVRVMKGIGKKEAAMWESAMKPKTPHIIPQETKDKKKKKN